MFLLPGRWRFDETKGNRWFICCPLYHEISLVTATLVARKLILERQQQRLGNRQIVGQGAVGSKKALFQNPDVVVAVEGYIGGLAVEEGALGGRSMIVQHRVSVGDPAQIEHVMHMMVEAALFVLRRLDMLFIHINGAGVLSVTGGHQD